MKQLNIPITPPLVYKTKPFQDNKIKTETETIKKQYRIGKEIQYKNDIWKRFKVGKEVNGITTVKGLYELQNNKCCYCEQEIDLESARLDHYRPRQSYDGNTVNNHNGYNWLAYDWNNFLVLCEICNSRKSSKFPLTDITKRVTDIRNKIRLPQGFLGEEDPLLINPRFHDPYQYYVIDESKINITKEIYLIGIDTNNKGHYTINEVIDLNRKIKSRGKTKKDFLMKKRFTVIDKLRGWINMIEGHEMAIRLLRIADEVSVVDELNDSINDIKKQIIELLSDDAEFSGLCQKYIIEKGKQDLL